MNGMADHDTVFPSRTKCLIWDFDATLSNHDGGIQIFKPADTDYEKPHLNTFHNALQGIGPALHGSRGDSRHSGAPAISGERV